MIVNLRNRPDEREWRSRQAEFRANAGRDHTAAAMRVLETDRQSARGDQQDTGYTKLCACLRARAGLPVS
jgi:hypothetical protein